jgi:hypothetical protein
LKLLNEAADIYFIKADVSLLKEIDRVCDFIQCQVSCVNVLFLSCGMFTLNRREGTFFALLRFHESDDNLETVEGLDRKLSLHYYGRMRFIQNLIPHLANASHVGNSSCSLARVVSVLGAGHENKLHLDDLDLRKNYSVEACDVHATTMTSLMVKEFASRYPSITFIHTYPGIVKSGIAREAGPVLRPIITAAMFLGRLWMVPKQESGERLLFAVTSGKFARNAEVPVSEISKGAYLLNWDDSEVGNEALLNHYLVNGVGDTVWKHTKKIFREALDYYET